MNLRILATIVALGLAVGGVVRAQGLALPGANSKAPIEITAQHDIEWQQKARAYIARGRARAVQGDSTVDADQLVAYYEGGDGGGATRIVRIDADGAVKLASPTGTATGAKAVYNVEQGILVLTGSPLLVTPTDRISARNTIEYWRDRNMVVARGGAVATREDKRLAGDVLVGHIGTGKDGKEKIVRIDGFDNVVATTPTDVVRADRAVYNVETGIADLTGSVKITRCNSQLNGDRAQVNMNSGIATLLSGPSGGPVRGIIVPGDRSGPGQTACPEGKK
jgi:lipopolysaccharide export system protein LptA